MKINIGPKEYLNFSAHVAFGANLTTWLRLLWMYRGEVDWQFIPKIMFITCVIIMSTPVIWFERLKYAKAIERVELQDPIFILGHPRSGTTYLHYLLCKDPQFAFCNVYESLMPWTFLTAESTVKRIMATVLPDTRPMDNMKLHAESPKEEEFAMGCMGIESMVTGYCFPKQLYPAFRKYVLFDERESKAANRWKRNLTYFLKKLTVKYGSKRLVLKSPHNTARVKEILELFPKATFIHIHRDPYTVYRSTERLWEKTLPMIALQKYSEGDIEKFMFRSYTDLYETYFRDRELIPDGQIVELAYEDLIGNEMEVLERVYADLDLPGFEHAAEHIRAEVESQANYKTNEYVLDDELKGEIYGRWASVFERLGYSR